MKERRRFRGGEPSKTRELRRSRPTIVRAKPLLSTRTYGDEFRPRQGGGEEAPPRFRREPFKKRYNSSRSAGRAIRTWAMDPSRKIKRPDSAESMALLCPAGCASAL